MSNKNKIYDCFLFFNELELLEIRLNVLNNVVDYFVLVESTKTFTNHDKPLHYKENKEKFKDFNDKIIHIVVDDHPPYQGQKNQVGDIWEYDFYQRNQITRGLEKADDEDIVVLSDLDEIINPNVISQISEENDIVSLQMYVFYYYLNFLRNEKEYTPKVFKKKYLEDYSPQEIRDLTGSMKVYPKGGWHFSYLGNKEKIEYKLQNTAHQQFNTEKIVSEIEYKMNNGIDLFDRGIKMTAISIDNNYPKYILENQEKYKHLIKERSFKEIAESCDTDKVKHHRYDRFYPRFLESLRDEKFKMLEIGYHKGGSLRLWKEYFPKAYIDVVDIDIEDEDERSKVYKLDQSKEQDLQTIVDNESKYKFIIDDGSHHPYHQFITFSKLFTEALEEGGVYIIEDIECNYWASTSNACGYTIGHFNFMDLLKQYPDKINKEFTGFDNPLGLSSITFGHNCVIIIKATQEEKDIMNKNYRYKEIKQ